MAKIMVHSPTRMEAIEVMKKAIVESKVGGVSNNLAFLGAIFGSDGEKLYSLHIHYQD